MYAGIDPGQSGGLCVIDGGGNIRLLEKMPGTERDIWDMINLEMGLVIQAMIEKVHARPREGVSSTFKFGCGYGGLRMALTAAEIPFDEVTPQAWQKSLGVARRTKTESKRDHKKKLLAKAQSLFPKAKITLATADALLIAEFCRRKYEGIL
jgi:crossover junction endodeoxyribonuclease RuvC